MPKFKEVIRDVTSDKEERAQDGANYLSEKGIKLYNKDTGKELDQNNLPEGIGRYDGGDQLESYLNRLAEKGFVQFDALDTSVKAKATIQQPIDVIKEKIEGANDEAPTPPTPPTDEGPGLVGTSETTEQHDEL
ncbi:hypothetical protein NOVO_04930 [Rickettsiales bacterium Ac37b]|nr:hypothetical protein NOVO_04930 [Rickettsiales bacterium Ac37b]